MKTPRAREGFVLMMTLVFTAVATVVVGAAVGYVAQGTRTMRVYVARDRCRFAAQSAIELAKNQIQTGFNAYVNADESMVRLNPRAADVYDWFDHVSSDRRSIGAKATNGKGGAITLMDFPKGVNGCKIWLRIGRGVDHKKSSTVAIVPVVATAQFTYPDGLAVSATVQESVCFTVGQNSVFDYAYFVNNYGWMNGSTITINGDMRANGNVSLVSSTVNGFIYAAANEENGAPGDVILNSAKIRNASDYRKSATQWSRPDFADYEKAKIDTYDSGAYDAPKASGSITKQLVSESGNKKITNPYSEKLPMPFISDLDDYVSYARDMNGTLSCPAYTYTDSASVSHTVEAKKIAAHYDGVGPSGDATLADKGAIVLKGTKTDPIIIDGPVVIDSDVIIGGYVKGQGTIYSGRNIHIIDDLQYVDAPSWAHPDSNAQQTIDNNYDKPLVGLMAKGNIIIGDSSSSSWMNSVKSYINGGSSAVSKPHSCDPSDAAIGYPATGTFNGNYTQTEKATSLSSEMQTVAATAGGWSKSNGQFGKVRTGTENQTVTTITTTKDKWSKKTKTTTNTTTKAVTVLKTSYDRRYYETVCDDKVMQSLKNSSGISRVDAVLYNNHAIMGTPGRSGTSFNLNGALICRDEALIFSGNGINFNWDIRLKSSRNYTRRELGLPPGLQDPYTVAWQVVPSSFNPAFANGDAP